MLSEGKPPQHHGNTKLYSCSPHEFEEKDTQIFILNLNLKNIKLLVGHDVQLSQSSPEYRHHLTWV